MGALLGVLALCGAVGWWAGTYERAQVATRTLRIEAPVSTREPWESEEDEPWQSHESNPELPEPHAFMLWDGIRMRRAECPKCAAVNAERRKNEIPPLPLASVSVRTMRGRATYCYLHDEAVYEMSEDTVIRYDPRFHRQTPDDQQRAA